MGKTVNISVRQHGDGKLKVIWEYELRSETYIIASGILKRIADDVRKKLGELVSVSMISGETNFGQEVKNIAQAGSNLYDALFLCDEDNQEKVDEIKYWASKLAEDHNFVFTVDANLHIPWGLIYDDDPDEIPEVFRSSDVKKCYGFWAIKFNCSTVYNRIGFSHNIKHKENFKILATLHENVVNDIKQLVPNSEYSEFSRIIDNIGCTCSSGNSFFEAWDRFKNKDSLLFFYCHANGLQLDLSNRDSITADQMRLKLGRTKQNQFYESIVFLNGCSTAVGNEKGGFFKATSRKGFAGFIGTEAKVPDVFAFRFGIHFLKCFIEHEMSVIETMNVVRKDHLPLSLLYGIYCHPLYKIESKMEVESRRSDLRHNCNLSFQTLGSNTV